MTKMTQEEASDYFDHLVKTKGFTPDEANGYIGEKVSVGSGGAWDKTKQVAGMALDGLGRAMDYTGGLSRTAIADTFMDADKVTGDDWSRALKGKAPDSDELMQRSGAGEMGSVDVPLLGKVTGRGALGFGMDVASDPLTYLSLGAAPLAKAAAKGGAKATIASALLKLDKAANLPGDLVAAMGKKTYKSGLKGVDQVAAKFGKEPVSDLLLDEKVWGRASTIQNKMDDIGEKALKSRDGILKQATRSGAEVSMDEAMAPTMARIKSIRASKDPKLQPLADALESEVNNYLKLGPKKSEQALMDLPRGVTMGGGHTKVDFLPQSQKVSLPVGDAPVGARMIGDFTEVTLPKKVKTESLSGSFNGSQTPIKLTTVEKDSLAKAVARMIPGDPAIKINPHSTEVSLSRGSTYAPPQVVHDKDLLSPAMTSIERIDLPVQKKTKGGKIVDIPGRVIKGEAIPEFRVSKGNAPDNFIPDQKMLTTTSEQYIANHPLKASFPTEKKWEIGKTIDGSYTPKTTKFTKYDGEVIPGKLNPGQPEKISPMSAWVDEPAGLRIGHSVPDMPLPQKPLKVITDTNPMMRAIDPKDQNTWGLLQDITGVSPVQSTKMTTTAGAKLPADAFTEYALMDAAAQSAKEMQGGLRNATRLSVGRTLGKEAEEQLIRENDKLGRVLTTREKAAKEALKEQNKNALTQVDGLAMGLNPKAAMLKKIAEIAQMTPVRTGVGLGMYELGTRKGLKPVTSSAIRQSVREARDEEFNPWMSMPWE